MKFPSIQNIINEGFKTFLRFPLTISISIISSFVAISLFDSDYNSEKEAIMLNILHTGLIGIVWFANVDFFIELKKFNINLKIIFRLSAVILLMIYYFLLPVPFLNIHIYRGVLLAIGLHLLFSFIPFLAKGNQNSFWNFNQELFVRGALSVSFSAILFIGVSIAIAAANYLFKLDIDEEIYFKFWILVVGIFNTLIFLSGIPNENDLKKENTFFPTFLKVLVQFILLPLVTLYLAILYFYSIGIIVDWEMPKGVISYMIIGFSILGILSLLLIYPLQSSEKHNWIRIFSKWFYFALIPLIILLFVAIGIRVSEYGITENRYFIIILAIWLLGISIYMLINKQKNIKIIPISLSILAFVAAIGPISAFNISKYSQLHKLENLLIENQILKEGIIQAQENVDNHNKNQIESIVYYISNTHGYKPFKKFIDKNELDSIYLAHNKKDIRDEILLMFGIKLGYQNTQYESFYFSSEQKEKFKDVRNWDYIFVSKNYFNDNELIEQKYKIAEKDEVKIEINSTDCNIKVFYQENNIEVTFLETIQKIIDEHKNTYNYGIDKNEMTLFNENEFFKVKIEFDIIDGEIDYDKQKKLYRADFEIYLKIK